MVSGRQGILLDQNIPYGVTAWLRQAFQGTCDVDHVADVGLAGSTDQEVFEWARLRQRPIVTYDEDFADQRLFPVVDHHGIVRLRVEPTTEEATRAVLDRPFTEFEPRDLDGKLVIVDRGRIRIRP